VTSLELDSKRTLFAILKFRKIIKKEIKKKYLDTILISNIHYANVISLISCFGLKKLKVILTERTSLSELIIKTNFNSYIKNRVIFILAKFLYPLSKLIITNSIYEKNFIKKYFRLKKIVCIHPPSISKIKKNLNVNVKYIKNKIIYVGRLSKEKNVTTIIEALALVVKKYKFIFEIYGKGNEKKQIQKLIKKYKLRKYVFFKGHVIDEDKIFNKALLFVNASDFEGLSSALVQSINYNVFPICSSSPGGNIEAINYGKLGMSFETGNHIDLHNKIIFFLKNKIKLNNKIRINHLKKFTEKNSNANYFKILSNLK
jgi:glycosyltransferase involved in cell wall biosynthesis